MTIKSAFCSQLYTEEFNDDDNEDDDEDPNEADIDNGDYDSNYDDDDAFSSRDYSQPTFGARPSDFPDSSSTIAPVPSPPEITADKTILKWAAATVAAYKAEAKQSQESSQKRNHRTASHQERKKILDEKSDSRENNTKQKRDVLDDIDDDVLDDLLLNWRTNLKRKRSIDRENHHSGSRRSFVKRQESYRGTLGSSFRESSEDSNAGEQNTLVAICVFL